MNLLRSTLESLIEDMNSGERIGHDPILFPHRFHSSADIEVAGFIAASLAYGKVDLFLPVLETVFSIMGESPAGYCFSFNPKKESTKFERIYYRFNTGADIASMLLFIGNCLREMGSLSSLFYSCYLQESENTREGIAGFLSYFRSQDPSPVTGERKWSHGLNHLFPSPQGSSALKRFNLFLRWMVRGRGVDFGIWDRVSPSRLIIPLDTHILRVGSHLGLTGRKGADMQTALEITSALSKLDPEDPVKYDFALCHFGISGRCPQTPSRSNCNECVLWNVCNRA